MASAEVSRRTICRTCHGTGWAEEHMLEITCTCGRKFQSALPHTKYCSDPCRERAKRARKRAREKEAAK
jgi:hypothetical protein